MTLIQKFFTIYAGLGEYLDDQGFNLSAFQNAQMEFDNGDLIFTLATFTAEICVHVKAGQIDCHYLRLDSSFEEWCR